MKAPRWLVWISSIVLLVTIAVTGAHVHRADASGHDHCMVCTLAHAPAIAPEGAPVLVPPAPTRDRAADAVILAVEPPLRACPSSRAPPRG